MDGNSAHDLSGLFDRVMVINLARRHDRLEQFHSRMTNWPFKVPQRFEAFDGTALDVPTAWDKGPGAWGCMLSHRMILDQAFRDGVRSLLVLEDDAFPAEDFAARALSFLADVPADWDGLHFGPQNLLPARPVRPGVERCVAAIRMHAYALRGRLMPIALQFLKIAENDHCDVVLSALMTHFNFYAPDPPLIGQGGGQSDITGRRENLRFLSAEQTDRLVGKNPRFRLDTMVVKLPAKFHAGTVTPSIGS